MDIGKLIFSIKPEHLISMALAFIFIVSACASLIISANGKIDRISSRFRRACELWRNPDTGDDNLQTRRACLEEQIRHFYRRYEVLKTVQKLLFAAICLFIGSYFFYVFAGVFVLTNMGSLNPSQPPEWLQACVVVTLGMMTGLFIVGIVLMLIAAQRQIKETANSHQTLIWECKDIINLEDTPNKSFEPTAS